MDLRDIISFARCILLAGAARLQNGSTALRRPREDEKNGGERRANPKYNRAAESIETTRDRASASARATPFVTTLRSSLPTSPIPVLVITRKMNERTPREERKRGHRDSRRGNSRK